MSLKLGFSKVRNFLFIFVLIAVSFAGGYEIGVKGFRAELTKSLEVKISRQTPPEKNVDMSLFWQVWDTLTANYYDKEKLVPSEMIYGAISGMVSAVGDPYTMFLPPKENKIVNEDLSGSFEGVGIELGYKQNRLAVVSPLSDSPAEKAGVKAGDFVARIKDDTKGIDINAQGLSLPEAVDAIRGKSGTKVTLTLVRDGEAKPVIVEITRAKLTIPSATLEFIGTDKNIAYIKLAKFDADTQSQWDKAVSGIDAKCQAVDAKCKGIVIDLRNNPGGYLQTAVNVASDFLPQGSLVTYEVKGDGTKSEYKSEKLPRLSKYKVILLINGGSASASEILAGALRDDRNFKLIGEKSFGKGTVQDPIEIPGGSGLHVTIAKWLTPKGTWVHGTGLTPDILIVPKDTDKGDVQLEGAIGQFN